MSDKIGPVNIRSIILSLALNVSLKKGQNDIICYRSLLEAGGEKNDSRKRKLKKISLSLWSKEYLDHERHLARKQILETEDGRHIKDMNRQDVQEKDKDKKTR